MKLLQYLPRFREAERELEVFASREKWSRSQIQAYQLDQINELWRHARTCVPYYRQLSESRSLPERFASLAEYSERMPILPKSKVRISPNDFLAESPKPGKWHRTGGSTGSPTAIYWEYGAHRHVLRSKYRNEQRHGLDIFDKKVFLWGHSGSYEPGIKGLLQKNKRPFEDWLRNRLRVSAYDLSDDQLRSQLSAILHFGPKSLYGYSSAIGMLARVAREHQFELPSLEIAILTAEPADPHLRSRVSAQLNCPAVLEYGAAECAFIAGQTPEGEVRVRDDVVFLETPSNDHGNCDLVLTVLRNPSFPMMRYAIEDTTSEPLKRPEGGFGVLEDIQGRKNDMLLSQTGRRLHAMSIKHTLEHYPEIRRFTAHQHQAGDLDVVLETNDPIAASLRSSLQKQFVDMLDGYPVTIREVKTIPGNIAGKHRWIISDKVSLSDDKIALSDPVGQHESVLSP